MMRQVLILVLLWLSAAMLPAQAAPQPFRLAGGQVVFNIVIEGRKLPALLDTGATRSLIELGLAKELGIRSQRIRSGGTVGVTGGRVSYGQTEKLSLDLGAGPMTRRIGTYPAGLAFADEDVRVVIGMDYLSDLVVSLDFEAMTIDFQRSATFIAPAEPPLTLMRSGWYRPTLTVTIAGAPAQLLLDTAAAVALHLEADFVAETPALHALQVFTRTITGIDGVRDHDAVIVPRVVLGGEVFEDVKASSGSLAQLHAPKDMDGVVGVSLLKQFNLVIDFGRHRLWMTPHPAR